MCLRAVRGKELTFSWHRNCRFLWQRVSSCEVCFGSRQQVETVSRSLECSASVEGGLERFESGDLLRKQKTSVPFRDHDPSDL